MRLRGGTLQMFGSAMDAVFPARKAMRELRGRWGRPAAKASWLASAYFDLLRERRPADCVDDKTWGDLELPGLFAVMDSCVTPLGSQVLFRQLREYVADADALAARYAGYDRLQADPATREILQRKLLPLQDEMHARIAGFVFDELPPPLPHRGWLSGWSLASVAVLAATIALAWS